MTRTNSLDAQRTDLQTRRIVKKREVANRVMASTAYTPIDIELGIAQDLPNGILPDVRCDPNRLLGDSVRW